MGLSFIDWMIHTLAESLMHQEPFGSPNQDGRRELVVLVGPPAVGKSTFVAKSFPPADTAVVNRDSIVERVAASHGLTYDDLFAAPPKDAPIGSLVPGAEKFGEVVPSPPHMAKYSPTAYEALSRINAEVKHQLDQAFANAIASPKRYLVVDMTHMTAKNRLEVMGRIAGREKEFHKRAVVFSFGESDMPRLIARLERRNAEAAATGRPKTIPPEVVKKAVAGFQAIDPAEGFDQVETVSTFKKP